MDPRLANLSPDSHDVCFIAKQSDRNRKLTGSIKHWSFYCQGHFYHLSTPGLRRDTIEKSSNGSKSQGVPYKLNHEDYSDVDPEDWRRLQEIRRRSL